MQGPKFLYDVVNKVGQSASFVNGTLIWNSIYTPLDLTPNGWQQLSILTERNKDSFGLDITYGVPQDFLLSAASIIKSILFIKGTEEICYLRILELQLWLTDVEYGYYYDQICKTEIDLSTAVDSGGVSAQILDGDVTKYMKARKSIIYSIDIDSTNRQAVLMDGLSLQESAQFIIQDPLDVNFRAVGNHIIGLSMTTAEQKGALGAQSTTRLEIDQSNKAGIIASNDQILTSSGPSVVTGIMDFAVTVQRYPGSGVPVLPQLRFTCGFLVIDSAGNIVNYPGNENIFFDSGPGFESGFGRHVIKVTKTFSLPADCKAYPRCSVNVTNSSYAGSIQFIYDNNSISAPGAPNLTLNYTFKQAHTVCYCLTAKTLGEALMNKMTDGQYTLRSDLLDNPDLNIFFTCGDSLRRLVGAQIKISMGTYLQALNVPYGTGYGTIASQLRIEKKRFWVAPDDAGVQLGDSGDGYKLYPAADMTFASFKIGYPSESDNSALGDINGKFEFNVTQTYNTPITRVDKVLDITTTVKTSMYKMEETRINLEGKLTTSDNADNDIFMVHVEKNITPFAGPFIVEGVNYTALWFLDRSINQYIQNNNLFANVGDIINGLPVTTAQWITVGVLDKNTAFNVALSPKQCLIRSHGDYIHSCIEHADNKYLTFANSNKNSGLLIISQPGGVDTEENGNVLIGSLKATIFKPWYFEGQIVTPSTLTLTIAGNPVRKYLTNYKSIPISGTAMKTAIAPTDNAQQAYQLLLGPDVDITPFITVYE